MLLGKEWHNMADKLTDLPGIGEKTEKELREFTNRPTGRIGTELTVNEAQSMDFGGRNIVDNILTSSQKQTLRTEGGKDEPKSGLGGGKIPDGFKRTGDFLYEKGQRQEAGRMFNDLSEARQEDDRGERARVTTDLEEWEDNKSGLDFPGIDTPTRKPREKDKDLGFTIEDLK